MEKKWINLNGLDEERMMSPKEMKNVLGGSEGDCPEGSFECYCGSTFKGCYSSTCACAATCGYICY